MEKVKLRFLPALHRAGIFYYFNNAKTKNMTLQEFHEQIESWRNRPNDRDLEEWLSALLLLVEKNKDEELNAEKLLNLFDTVFTSEAAAFENAWLKIKVSPAEELGYLKPCKQSFVQHLKVSPAEFSMNVIKFQIGELHHMRNNQVQNLQRYMGLESGTGHDWYNWDPHSILMCGTQCLMDHIRESDFEFTPGWERVGELLEMGRVYE